MGCGRWCVCVCVVRVSMEWLCVHCMYVCVYMYMSVHVCE